MSIRTIFKKYNGTLTGLFALIFFIGMQSVISGYVNLDTVYHYRIKYPIFLDDRTTFDVVVEEIANTIQKDKLEDYIIMAGNSVAWGTNERSDHSLGKYLNDLSQQNPQHRQVVFNLSMPSMQAGDIYTLLLMLEKKGIKTDNLIIGLTYSAFVDRSEGPRAVFWLGDHLRQLDPPSFADVKDQLIKDYYVYKTGWSYIEDTYTHKLLNIFPLYKYKGIIESYWEQEKKDSDLLGNPKPWYEKKYTDDRLQRPEYLSFFNPEPFVMEESNWGVYFMNKIIKHQAGKNMLVFVAGGNSELSKKEVSTTGYQQNLLAINKYLQDNNVDFINLQDKIPSDYFTDHVHLTKDGNKLLADIVWGLWQERRTGNAL
ncbi:MULTISPECIES: hypothetical protein [unclassified Paenibacillus]|uniref:hypothetical protein n=1 Tax=unclassified Paenibacillus TaxID=185978 RepID=UPI002F4201D9